MNTLIFATLVLAAGSFHLVNSQIGGIPIVPQGRDNPDLPTAPPGFRREIEVKFVKIPDQGTGGPSGPTDPFREKPKPKIEAVRPSPTIRTGHTSAGGDRQRSEGYVLPSGVEFVVGDYRSTFSCNGRNYGYFADQDNGCQIFHICVPSVDENGIEAPFMYSFFCGNQTIFDQHHLVCTHPSDAVPCEEAHNFFWVNDNFGKTDTPFLVN